VQSLKGILNHLVWVLFQTYNNPEDKCSGVFNVTQVPGIYINETDCVEGSRFDEIKELFDIPRAKRITGTTKVYRD
jgi:hypothetical protein